MVNQQLLIKHQAALEKCALSIRGATGFFNVHFEGDYLYNYDEVVVLLAPHLQYIRVDNNEHNLSLYRSYADCVAAKFNYSEPLTHNKFCPANAVERFVFEMLEQLRVESLASEQLAGVRINILYRFKNWCDLFFQEKLAHTGIGILFFALALMCWARLNNRGVFHEYDDDIESTRAALSVAIGNDLKAIKICKLDQATYAKHALNIARTMRQMLEHELKVWGKDINEISNDEYKSKNMRLQYLQLRLNFNPPQKQNATVATSDISKNLTQPSQRYSVFSTKFDIDVAIDDLVRTQQLTKFRESIDLLLNEHKFQLHSLARIMQMLFSTNKIDGVDFFQEFGYLDSSKLVQVVTNNETRVFQLPSISRVNDAIITFLIDCSGSMKQHINQIIIVLDTLLKGAHIAKIPTEVLGFTTSAWNGGRAYKLWKNKPNQVHKKGNPGRMNERLHICFKTKNDNYSKARNSIAGLLKMDMFKEGNDGEAVEWAIQRQLATDYQQKYLVVLSDGCPMDTATNRYNGTDYLDNHLKHVVRKYNKNLAVNIFGIGVGLDMSSYYPNNCILDIEAKITQKVLVDLLFSIAKTSSHMQHAQVRQNQFC